MLIRNLFKYWTYQLFSPGTVLKEKYVAFKSLLAHDKRAHELMAELEEIYYHEELRDFTAIEKLCAQLSRHVAGIVDDLSHVCPSCYPDLLYFYKKIDAYVRFMTTPENILVGPPFVLNLDETGAQDLHLVGGKALNLAIVKNTLGLPVPDGFTITTNAYHHFIEHNGLREKIDDRLACIDIGHTASLDALSAEIQELIMAARLPLKIEKAVAAFFHAITGRDQGVARVAMRSSAVGEDSQASFAGQYLSVLNIKREDLGRTYKKIIAGKYSSEAIYYRVRYGLVDIETPMAVLVLKMVDAMTSGVMYTAEDGDSESGNMKIHAIRGLGERLVSGQTSADIFTIAKRPPSRIVAKQPAANLAHMIYESERTASPAFEEKKLPTFCIDNAAALKLAQWGRAIEEYFQKPQDVEWAFDRVGNGHILQSRPLNAGIAGANRLNCEFEDVQHERLLQGGERAASGIGAGVVYNVKNESTLQAVPDQAVLVARSALPQYVKVIDRLSAVVTDLGSSAGHFASVAREFGIPTLVNMGDASKVLKHGQTVTVHADGRSVYAGSVTELLESPCARINPIVDSPFMRKLRYVMEFVSTLELVDPEDRSFTPQRCRSLHDIIRFAHEKAVQEMFHISDNRLRKLSFAKQLESAIPMQFYILDVGGGLKESAQAQKTVRIEDVRNKAMKALWTGLTHPDIQWGAFQHFDWEAHDRIVMSGGIASPKATMFASHAVISNDYMNLNLRFGYHFVIVDALCGTETADNTILFRFSGGGAELKLRMLRADFLYKILDRLGFNVTVKSDLVDGQLQGADLNTTLQRLDMLGRLLGATRLMDMYLKDAAATEGLVDDFMQGRYHFASVETE
jgi:pyruvate,water dikinase